MGANDGGGSGVGTPVGAVMAIISASKKPRKPFNPFGVAKKAVVVQQQADMVRAKIEAAGADALSEDIILLATLNERLDRLQRKFEKQQKKKPKRFTQAGFPVGVTFQQLLQLFGSSPLGQRLLGTSASVQAMLAATPPLLPSITGGSPVPFVVSPSSGSGDSGGFGGFLNNLITAGAPIAQQLLAPKNQPQPYYAGGSPYPFANQPVGGARQASMVPAIGGVIGRALTPSAGAIGGGILGGELADAFQNLWSGGSGTNDESAAFTDAVPGACRPKAHVKSNPCTGKGVWFVPRGQPLVFSGDLSACKRVDRVAKRLSKSMPRRKAACSTRRKR